MTKQKQTRSQTVIIWLCWAVYLVACAGRYSYSANIGLIIDDFGINHAQAGLVTTCFFFAYGVGQVVNGIMCKHYNKKYLFPIVLIASALINLSVYLKIPFYMVKYVWLLNGILQSCLWSSIVNVISNNVDSKNLNKAMFILSSPTLVGILLAYGGSALFAWLNMYRVTFLTSSALMLTMGIIWLFVFKPSGLKVGQESTEQANVSDGMVAMLPILATLAMFAVIHSVIRDGLNTWVPVILKENYGIRDEFSIILTMVLPFLGMLGAMVSIKLNKVIKDFVVLVTVLFAATSLFIALFTFKHNLNMAFMVACFGIVVFIMYAANNVITSVAPLKMRDRVDSGKMAGILNGFCYLGSTITSYGLGALSDAKGWGAVFMLLLISCIGAICIGLLYILVNKSRNR